ncbi:hypothetical protein FRC17_006599 [Serendipita sp. 399]|nr:hypothetical protein FRC17_006599 [Serendipita sp. 399]
MATANPLAAPSQNTQVAHNGTVNGHSNHISHDFDDRQETKILRKSHSSERKFSLDGYDEKGVLEDDLESEGLVDESPGWDVASGFYTSKQPGWEGQTWSDVVIWWVFAVLKMVTGVSAIFAWRLIVKQIMHTVLPPIFRWMSGLVGNIGLTLPNRRWYTPATEYERVPGDGLHPIPSSMNLPAELSQRSGFGTIDHDEDAHTTGRLPHAHIHNGAEMHMKWRGSANSSGVGVKPVTVQEYVDSKGEKIDTYDDADGHDVNHEKIKHYDADVLTKVIVYSGIGAIATYLTPVAFETLGWGVQPVV